MCGQSYEKFPFLHQSFVIKAEKRAICHDDVVCEAYVHGLCTLLHSLCEVSVFLARTDIARGMIVYQDDLRGSLQQGFAQDEAHIYCGLVDAAFTDAYLIYNLISLV